MNENWTSFTRRIEGVARDALANNTGAGVAIISVKVLVDAMGNPLLWTPPAAYRIEPTKDAVHTLMDLFVTDDS